MHGNAWEWVEDCWHGNNKNAPSDGSAWVEESSCRHRMLRDGSWSVGPRNARSAVRSRFAADIHCDGISFQVARAYQRGIDQPAHLRAFLNICSHGPCSPQCGGCHECCTVRMMRSGCGIMIVARPSAVVMPATLASEPLGLAG